MVFFKVDGMDHFLVRKHNDRKQNVPVKKNEALVRQKKKKEQKEVAFLQFPLCIIKVILSSKS